MSSTDRGSRLGPSGRFGHKGWTGRHGQYGLEGQGTHSVYDQTAGVLQAGEQMGYISYRSREELGRLYVMGGQVDSGREPDSYGRLYGMGSSGYSSGAGGFGSSSYGSRGYGTSSYGTSTYGTSGYNSRSPSRYDTSNYGTTSYGMRTGVHGTAGYGSTGSRDFAVGGYAPSSKSRGEVFQSSRYGPRCKRYNIPWQESVARVWGFPPQSGDIGTQDYCQPGEGKTGPIWQGRRRGMQRLPQSRTRLAYGGSGLQGSGFTTYGREMIRSGAVPHYEWGKYSSGMRQIAEQRRTRRTQFQPPYGTRAQQPSLTGIDQYKYRRTSPPLYREPSRRLWEQYGSHQGEYSQPYSPAQFVTPRFAGQAQTPSVPLPPPSSFYQGGQPQGFAPTRVRAPGDLSREFSERGFTATMGAVPLYPRDIWSSRMRQIETTGARARRGLPGPSWDTNRQPWSPTDTATQPSTRAPSYHAPTTGRQMSTGTGAYPTATTYRGSRGRGTEMQDWGEIIAPGAIPLYEWEKVESLYRQREANQRPTSRGPSWKPNRPPWAPSRQTTPMLPRSQQGPEFTSYGCDMAMAGGMSPRQAQECSFGARTYGTIGTTETRFVAGRYGEGRITSASPDTLRGAYAGMSGPETSGVEELGAQQIGGSSGEGEYARITSTPRAMGQMFGPTEQIPRPMVGETTCLMRAETGPYIPGSDYNKPRREGAISYRKDQCGL